MSRFAIGLVGCGNWGQFILRDLVSLGAEVTVVARSEASRSRAQTYGAASIVGDVASLPVLDGAVVATSTSSHAEVVAELLDRGLPVFVEKPLTTDLGSAQELAKRAPDTLFVMDKWRYHAGVQALAEIARSGELGPVLGLQTTRVQAANPHDDVDAVWVLTPHDLAIGLEILGCYPEPRTAVAEVYPERPGHAQGIIGVLGKEPWMVIEVSATHREHRRGIRLHCADGLAVLSDAYDEHIEILRPYSLGDKRVEQRPIATDMPLLAELRAFLDHLNGGPPPRSTAPEAAGSVETIVRLRELAGLESA